MGIRNTHEFLSPPPAPDSARAIADDPTFDPTVHLALTAPERTLTLSELGYSDSEVADCPTNFAVSSAFRLLSAEGTEAMQHVCRQLESSVVSCERIERMMRGGVYRSGFLRDLSLSPDINAFIAEICGASIIPHTMPHQLAHLNFEPREIGRSVDKWHHDTLGLDYVLMVTDPENIEGGEFQYFRGTRDEARAYRERGETIPEDRIETPRFPGAGYAVLQQGDRVVHRAAPLRALGERITMVNGYVFADAQWVDPTNFEQLRLVDPEPDISIEWLRHRAHRAQLCLQHLVESTALDADPGDVCSEIRRTISELESAMEQVERDRPESMAHYGD